jgi:prepilin-type N-terminal cleavage/methylation domain-containing protein
MIRVASMRTRRGRTGFTLIELLVVMAIVIFLASMLIAALWPQKDKALRSKTSAMINAIASALDQYYSEFHDFPPDGYDTEPAWLKANAYIAGQGPGKPGIKLGVKNYVYYGSGCLIYFLCYPIMNMSIIGADQGNFDPRNVRITPCNKGAAYLNTLHVDDISVHAWDATFDFGILPSDNSYGANWSIGEIIDAYGYPIHYDKVGQIVQNTDFTSGTINFQPNTFMGQAYPFPAIHSDQTYMSSFVQQHISPADNVESSSCPSGNAAHQGTGGPKHADPRGTADPNDGCFLDGNTPKPRNPGGYDLWAHGKYWGNAISAITNWK